MQDLDINSKVRMIIFSSNSVFVTSPFFFSASDLSNTMTFLKFLKIMKALGSSKSREGVKTHANPVSFCRKADLSAPSNVDFTSVIET